MNCAEENNVIETEEHYETTLKEIERLFFVDPDSAEGKKLETLICLVEKYEDEHYPIPLPDPIEAIQYYMESRGLTVTRL